MDLLAADLDAWARLPDVFDTSAVTPYLYDPVAWAHDVIDWPAGAGLTDYQTEILGELATRRRVAVRGPHGLGKALGLGVILPSPCGWTTVADVQPGDQVFDENGRPCRVTAKSPIFLGPTFEVCFADGSTIVAHGDHEWNAIDVYTRPRTPRPERKPIDVADWRDHWGATKCVTTAYMAERLRTPGGQLRWRIPTARPLDLPDARLPIDPYLLGVWAGDGSTNGSMLTLNRADADEIVPLLPPGRFPPGNERSTSRGFTIPGLRVQLRALGVLGDKHIPAQYLRASVAQRRELVRGLWDTDGYRQAGGCDEITLTCKRLVDGVAELLRSLGLAVRVREGEAKLNGRVIGPRWRIAARFDFNPYHLSRYDWQPSAQQASRHTQRTIVDIRRVEDQPTQCITVDSPSHLYLAGESMVPTHNSMTASLVVLWFATTRDAAGIDWKAPTTASAWRHLSVYLWPEIHKWARRIRWEKLGRKGPFNERRELFHLNLKLAYGAASAVASNDPAKIEGAHADSLLYLLDEAKTIPPGTWDAVEGAFSGGRPDGLPEAFALAVSTPGPPAGRFYEIHKRGRGLEDWWTRHVTLAEAIKAGRISVEWAEQRARQWGRESAIYHNRVLGEFHASDEASVIPLAWAEAAVERWHAWNDAGRPPIEGRHILGVDVARGGEDSTVIAHRIGPCVVGLEQHHQEDTMRTTARVQAALASLPEGTVAVVDSIGVGGGVVDRLRELDVPVLAYTGSAKTKAKDRTREHGHNNVRSAAWWHMRELLDPAFGAEVMLPPDDMLLADLNAPTWGEVTGIPPKIQLEKKEDLVARLGRSPDRGDATVMAFWADALRHESQVAVPTGQMPISSPSPFSPEGGTGASSLGPLGG